MTRTARSMVEAIAVAVSLVAGYLYLDELGKLWLFWALALAVASLVVLHRGRRRVRRALRRIL